MQEKLEEEVTITQAQINVWSHSLGLSARARAEEALPSKLASGARPPMATPIIISG